MSEPSRLREDVAAVTRAAIEIGRRGAIAAIAVTLSEVVVATGLVAAGAAIVRTSDPYDAYVLLALSPLALLGLALIQAAPLAAFALAARSGDVKFGETLLLATKSAPALLVLDLGVLLFAAFAGLVSCCLSMLFAPLGIASVIIVVLAEARWFLLARVEAVANGRDAFGAFDEAGRLGSGQFGLMLGVAVIPQALLLMARPSDVGVKAAQDLGVDLQVFQAAVAVTAWIASFFMGALLATAAWKTITSPTQHEGDPTAP